MEPLSDTLINIKPLLVHSNEKQINDKERRALARQLPLRLAQEMTDVMAARPRLGHQLTEIGSVLLMLEDEALVLPPLEGLLEPDDEASLLVEVNLLGLFQNLIVSPFLLTTPLIVDCCRIWISVLASFLN